MEDIQLYANWPSHLLKKAKACNIPNPLVGAVHGERWDDHR